MVDWGEFPEVKEKFKIHTVKLEFKERLNKEQLGNSEPFPVTNMPVHLINSEQIGFSEQLCNDQKVPYCQVWLYLVWQFQTQESKFMTLERLCIIHRYPYQHFSAMSITKSFIHSFIQYTSWTKLKRSTPQIIRDLDWWVPITLFSCGPKAGQL